ncbi:MAG: GNAT family N-acetyltransferase [Acidimicrobiia bacterium]|nr:GNAT family N-acetyltransferase [Acidimicrobiia bacterium]MCL4293309.1 GNAT family N-acetyltransferase [Acidimicrobiia bacterium]
MALPAGYRIRHPGPRDVRTVAEVVEACEIADHGVSSFGADDLEAEWGRPRFDRRHDAWVVTGPSGRIVGYASLWQDVAGAEVEAVAYVLPEYGGRGLGGHLLARIEERTAELARTAPGPVAVGTFASRSNAAKCDLLERNGYRRAHTMFRMVGELTRRRRAAVDPPDGIAIRAFRPGIDEELVHDAMDEAFSGTFRYTPRPLREWIALQVGHPSFDPDLWLVACDGDKPIGGILAHEANDYAFLSDLGVRPVWRRRGVASALLDRMLSDLKERGTTRVTLTVDGDDPDGVMTLFERAGMRVAEQHDWYEKVLPSAR